MQLLSIQVGKPKTVEFRGQPVTTGIFKDPIQGAVMVRSLNIDGDGQADLRVHGGVDKAVYGYAFDTYAWWKEKRPMDEFSYGAFGENLTFDTLPEDQIYLGDTFELGTCVLQAAQPRFPCFKLGVKFDDPGILKTFLEYGRPGVYFRVLRVGRIEAGQSLKLIDHEKERVSISALNKMVMSRGVAPEEIKRVLAISSLPDSLKRQFEKMQ